MTCTTLPTEQEIESSPPWRFENVLFPDNSPLDHTRPLDLWRVLGRVGWNLSLVHNEHGTFCYAVSDGVSMVEVTDGAVEDAMVKVAMVARLRDLLRGAK